MLRPLPFEWDGNVLRPVERYRALAERQFRAGQTYVLEPHDPISHRERRFYHASIKDAWDNLSPEMQKHFPTADRLRKWALVQANWRIQNFITCESEASAARHAAFLIKADDHGEMFVDHRGDVVRVFKARTQKVGDPDDGYMTPEEWKRSKDDVLTILSGTLGVTKKQLEKEGAR